VINNYY